MTAHVDTFVIDGMPPEEALPEFICTLPELEYSDQLNVAIELLENALSEGHGERVAIYCSSGNWTYAALNDAACKIANVLVEDMGLQPGNRVLLRAPNNPMMAACWFAVLKAGGIVAATMPLLRAKELSGIIDKGQISHALCDVRLLAELEACAAQIKTRCFGESGTLEAAMAEKSGSFETVQTRKSDPVLLSFTSGTTGRPKAVVHLHADIMAMADTFSRHIIQPSPDDIFTGTPPMAFTFGLGGILVFPLHARAATVMDEAASPPALLAAIEKFGVTTLFTAPTAYRAMLDQVDEHDLGLLKTCVSAGEALPAATWEAWRAATGIKLIDGIGATEMIHIFISAAGDNIRPGATGKPVPGYEAAVLDENLAPLPPGELGRLAVKGPTGCRYLDDPRQASYVQGGWNLTGDVYMMDEDGYFWFQARADDMIISGGYNIAGPEVENALLQHDAVAECAVVGVADERRGSVVKAFVVLRDGAGPGEALVKELQDFVKGAIAPYKYPRAIEFVDVLPKTQTGKLQRFRLREQNLSIKDQKK